MKYKKLGKVAKSMEIGSMMVDALKNFGSAIGLVVAIVGAFKTFEGFSQDNPAALSSGIKLVVGGIAIFGLAQKALPELSQYLTF